MFKILGIPFITLMEEVHTERNTAQRHRIIFIFEELSLSTQVYLSVNTSGGVILEISLVCEWAILILQISLQ
jgi:hypothetical protein